MVADSGSVGDALYLGAATGGTQVLGRESGRIEPGALADLVAVDATAPALLALREDQLLDGLCFAADDRVVTDLWFARRHCIRQGRHVARDDILCAYRRAMADLLAAVADG